jgi:hypothetical protein
MRANSGDSSSERRSTKLRNPPRPPRMKASRQPIVATASAGSQVRTATLTPVAAATPIVTQEKTTPQT